MFECTVIMEDILVVDTAADMATAEVMDMGAEADLDQVSRLSLSYSFC